jgi:hypothetical protein
MTATQSDAPLDLVHLEGRGVKPQNENSVIINSIIIQLRPSYEPTNSVDLPELR